MEGFDPVLPRVLGSPNHQLWDPMILGVEWFTRTLKLTAKMAPENRPKLPQKETIIVFQSIFRCLHTVIFRECKVYFCKDFYSKDFWGAECHCLTRFFLCVKMALVEQQPPYLEDHPS